MSVNTAMGLVFRDSPESKKRTCKSCKTSYISRNEDFCLDCWWDKRGQDPEIKVPTAKIYKLQFPGEPQ